MSDFPVIENPTKLKVAELKEELEKRGLPTSGLKKDVRPSPRHSVKSSSPDYVASDSPRGVPRIGTAS
jgi:hypothetical protein